MHKLALILALIASAQAQTLQQTLDSGQRYVQTPPGVMQLTAPLTIVTSGQTVDMSATTFQCPNADCIIVGDPSNYNRTSNVTLLRPQGAPTTCGGQHSFITVYGQHTHIYDAVAVAGPRSVCAGSTFANTGNFGHIVTVVSDQAFTLDGLDTGSNAFYCNPAFCSSAVWAPGPFSGNGGWSPSGKGDNAAVGWLSHLQIHPECQGNGVDWESGNTLVIRDSVIQGYAQFGVRAGTRRGGYGGVELDNVYMDLCQSPANSNLPNVGIAGLIAQWGGAVTIHSDRAPRGVNPLFAQSGPSEWLYYIVANNGTNDSLPLYLGSANTDDSTPVTGYFPVINGAVAYRVIKARRGWTQATGWISPTNGRPKGTGNWLVTTVQTTSCNTTTLQLNPDGSKPISQGTCSFIDPMTVPTSYTTATSNLYSPDIWLWPGDLILDGTYVLANDSTPYSVINVAPTN